MAIVFVLTFHYTRGSALTLSHASHPRMTQNGVDASRQLHLTSTRSLKRPRHDDACVGPDEPTPVEIVTSACPDCRAPLTCVNCAAYEIEAKCPWCEDDMMCLSCPAYRKCHECGEQDHDAVVRCTNCKYMCCPECKNQLLCTECKTNARCGYCNQPTPHQAALHCDNCNAVTCPRTGESARCPMCLDGCEKCGMDLVCPDCVQPACSKCSHPLTCSRCEHECPSGCEFPMVCMECNTEDFHPVACAVCGTFYDHSRHDCLECIFCTCIPSYCNYGKHQNVGHESCDIRPVCKSCCSRCCTDGNQLAYVLHALREGIRIDPNDEKTIIIEARKFKRQSDKRFCCDDGRGVILTRFVADVLPIAYVPELVLQYMGD